MTDTPERALREAESWLVSAKYGVVRSKEEIIEEMMYKDAESKLNAELDAKLANTTPPNTATASDGAGGVQNENTGVNAARDLKGSGRVTKW